jgi:hypothetical protein
MMALQLQSTFLDRAAPSKSKQHQSAVDETSFLKITAIVGASQSTIPSKRKDQQARATYETNGCCDVNEPRHISCRDRVEPGQTVVKSHHVAVLEKMHFLRVSEELLCCLVACIPSCQERALEEELFRPVIFRFEQLHKRHIASWAHCNLAILQPGARLTRIAKSNEFVASFGFRRPVHMTNIMWMSCKAE